MNYFIKSLGAIVQKNYDSHVVNGVNTLLNFLYVIYNEAESANLTNCMRTKIPVKIYTTKVSMRLYINNMAFTCIKP